MTNTEGDASFPPTMETHEKLLLAVASRQDRDAFAALFGHFGPRLKTYFTQGGTSLEMAEELVQETMLRVWRKAGYYDPRRAAVSTWVFTIARNLRIDFKRRQRDPALLPPEPDNLPPSIEDELLASERDENVRRALAKLSPEQQQIIRLSYYIDKSQTEIANELGIPLGTVKSRIRLAMNRLRAVLGENR
ncbi:MAG: sigma-70 family RNA polymerase sigma factor [Rhizobiaceae bacterium]|nr:sigma-70 family RNA polymerase sigma factor [Rhizobiaceae bacterium]